MKNFEVKVGKSLIALSTVELAQYDIIRISEDRYNVLSDNLSYTAEIIDIDLNGKTVDLRVNGKFTSCKITDELDLMIKSMKLGSSKKGKSKNLISNMPGLVLSIDVKEGQQVSAGDALMILEAMKMENVLKATSDGVIKSITCSEKDAVDKGQLLIEIE